MIEIRNMQLDLLAKQKTIINLIKAMQKDLEELNEKLDIDLCNECNEYKLEEDMGTSELAKVDKICKECMNDGYYL